MNELSYFLDAKFFLLDSFTNSQSIYLTHKHTTNGKKNHSPVWLCLLSLFCGSWQNMFCLRKKKKSKIFYLYTAEGAMASLALWMLFLPSLKKSKKSTELVMKKA